MTSVPQHRARVLSSPVRGVFATYSASGQHFNRHWHDVFGFGLLDDGAQHWRSGRGPIDAYAGDVITTNPGEVHDGRPLGGPTRHWRIVSVDDTTMASITGAHGDVEIRRPVIDDPLLRRTLHDLFASLERWNRVGGALHALAFEESLVEACVRLMSMHGTARLDVAGSASDMRIVRERLAVCDAAPLSLAELAALMGVSRFQLLRRFKAQFGLPPHAWLACHRSEHARKLIRDGSSLAAAAVTSGFADQSHMTRAFVRQFGYTPGAWRSSLQ